MKEQSILKSKSLIFSTEVIKLCNFLKDTKKDSAIYCQLIRSGTAIGALIREAEFAQSKADFINKLSVALKEANESDYWLNLLFSSQYIGEVQFGSISDLLTELIKMLVASIKTAKGIEKSRSA
jgi:four helix bundle protein